MSLTADDAQMDERPLSKRSWRSTVAVVLAFCVFTAVVEWMAVSLDNTFLTGLPFLVACGVMVCEFRRCPQCGRRLRARRKMLDHLWNTRYRVVYDCPHCQITWTTNLISDTKYDASGS
ncbi:MAG TPA: hypothetical protein VJL29_05475 [Thermoguttaceae bacterium]|nr:hypothetical protein [Thermoguttaceae bacterium]